MACAPRWSYEPSSESTGALVLSGHYEETYAVDLLRESPEGVGYLLKERVGEVEAFTDAVSRVAAEVTLSIPRWSVECSGADGLRADRSQS
jgi:hypothetical protein